MLVLWKVINEGKEEEVDNSGTKSGKGEMMTLDVCKMWRGKYWLMEKVGTRRARQKGKEMMQDE